jgi:predicted negative regulator of RcsB-dependent stress response
MTRHPTARKVHRQDAAPDDAFIAGVLETSVWAKQHGRKLVIGGIVAAVLVTALVLFMTSRSTQRAQAATQLTQVRAVAMSGNAQLAIRELEQFLEQFGGTPSAAEARLLLGRAYLENAQPQQALETVNAMAGDLGSPLGVNAAFLLAASHEAAQEPHRAEEVYLRVSDDAQFLYQRQDALDNAARIRLQRGDAAGAAQLYERLLEITPLANTERPIFELRLGEARAMAAGGNAAPGGTAPGGTAAPGGAAAPAGAPATEPTTTTGN